MITMNSARRLAILLFLASLTACVHTERFASEYSRQYFLAEDVHLYKSASFTGVSSAWFTGPESVATICSARIPARGATTLKKGSPVRLLKIIHVAGVDASSCEAKLHVLDRETNVSHVVFIRWPGSKSLLTTGTPDH
jgi:hypothetical protein